MEALIEFLMDLFGIETSTDKIMAKTRKTIRKLDRHNKRQSAKAAAAERSAALLKARAEQRKREAERAERARRKQEELLDY